MSLNMISSYNDHHRLALKLKPILVGELYLVRKLRHPVYIFKDGLFTNVIAEGSVPTKDQINALIKNWQNLKSQNIELLSSLLESAKETIKEKSQKVYANAKKNLG